MVDIHHLRQKRAIEIEPNRHSLKLKYKKYYKLELAACKIADCVFAISESEKQYMTQFCDSSKLKVLSNIHFTKVTKEETPPFEERKDLVFIGPSSHTPNEDALVYLKNEIMPLVWQQIPEMKVHVIGKQNNTVSKLATENFIIHGYVKDVKSIFLYAKLMVVPLRFGAGVKGKIGQSLEYWLPIVTTSIGAEGMQLTDFENALIADSTEAFAEKILKLYTNSEVWNKLHCNSSNSLYPFSREKLENIIDNL